MRREYQFYVYIMQSSSRRALYIGLTNNLNRRVFQHKMHRFDGFTDQYNAARLVYRESFDHIQRAMNREKQLKRWRRKTKLWLIARFNPGWKDLAADWYVQNRNARSLDLGLVASLLRHGARDDSAKSIRQMGGDYLEISRAIT